ncbi:MAG: amidohydrolase family protein [Acidimicrobiales bacterium]
MSADIVIRGGLVVDGTGAPPRRADVAITGDRISAIGDKLDGRTEVDASGCHVAPGFIDIHTHYDAQVFWDPALTPSCFHGVTTVVAGNCGFSIAPTRPEHRELIAQTLQKVEDMDVAALAAGIPWEFETFPQYLASVEKRGTVLNYAAYIGHTALRLYVLGDEAADRIATDAEINVMSRMVSEAMQAGAAGFATSFAMTHRGADGKPVPSRLADPNEYEALMRAVAQSGRGVVEVTPGSNLSIDNMYDVQKRVGVPLTYTALLTQPTGSHNRLVDVNRAGWADGAQVWPQVTCRPLSFSMTLAEPFTLNPNPEFAAIMGTSLQERREAYADPAWRDKASDAWANMTGMLPRWDTYEIMETTAHPELIGKRLNEVAEQRHTSPFDVVLDLALDEPELGLRVRCVVANDDVDGIRMLLGEDNCTLGLSDAGAHVGQLCDAPMATDLLGNWVRERQALSVEKAIRKLSGVQADLFGFKDRGYLREGAFADVFVFDLDTVGPGPVRRVRDFPANSERLTADAPTGVHSVFVNGTAIRSDGVSKSATSDPRPGRLAKPSPRS